MRRRRLPRLAFTGLVVFLYVFLLAPIAIVVIASLNAGRFLVFPPEGLSLQWYVKFARSGPFVRSFLWSLRLAAITTIVSTIIVLLKRLLISCPPLRFMSTLETCSAPSMGSFRASEGAARRARASSPDFGDLA